MSILGALLGVVLLGLTLALLWRTPEPAQLRRRALALGRGRRRWALLAVCLVAPLVLGVGTASGAGSQFRLLTLVALVGLPLLACLWTLGEPSGWGP